MENVHQQVRQELGLLGYSDEEIKEGLKSAYSTIPSLERNPEKQPSSSTIIKYAILKMGIEGKIKD